VFLSIFLIGVILESRQVLGLRRHDAIPFRAVTGITSSVGTLDNIRSIRDVVTSSSSRSRRRREILNTSSLNRITNRMCEVVSRLDAAQWWAAEKCGPSSIRPPPYPAMIEGTRQCMMDAFDNDIESYWEYHKICDFREKARDDRALESGLCLIRWLVTNMSGMLEYTRQQRESSSSSSVFPQIDEDAMRTCLADTNEFSDASDELIDEVVNLLKSNSEDLMKMMGLSGRRPNNFRV